jgi:hypothetical protein
MKQAYINKKTKEVDDASPIDRSWKNLIWIYTYVVKKERKTNVLDVNNLKKASAFKVDVL